MKQVENLTILYCGNTTEGFTGRDRITAFEANGFRVVGVDKHDFLHTGNRLERSIAARFKTGRAVAGYNSRLVRAAETESYDVAFVDKGVWVWRQTLRRLKAGARRSAAIHFTPDSQFYANRSRHFYRALPDYDLAITTKPFEVDRYDAAGARDVLLIHQGHGARFAPMARGDIPSELQSEICFIGHWQPAYARVLKKLAAHVPLAIWGPGWPEFAQQTGWARDVVRGGALRGSAYVEGLSGAKIAIGLLNKRIPETTTTRSFEIPATGTMMLAERTDDHMDLFEDGREAVFFGSPEELIERAQYYLGHDAEREAIAAAGLARCLSGGYAVGDQFRLVVDWIVAVCGDETVGTPA